MSNSLPLPADVRLMNLAAALLLLVFVNACDVIESVC
jgi:hypothetical protein